MCRICLGLAFAFALVSGCGESGRNDDRGADTGLLDDAALLAVAAAHTTQLDEFATITALLPLANLQALESGDWDGSTELTRALGDGCTDELLAARPGFGLRYTQTLTDCDLADSGDGVTRTTGSVVATWDGAPNGFTANVVIPALISNYADGSEVNLGLSAAFAADHVVTGESLSVLGVYAFSINSADSAAGDAAFDGTIAVQVAALAPPLFVIDGVWTYTRAEGTVRAELDAVEVDMTQCLFRNSDGVDLSFVAPAMPVDGTVRLVLESSDVELRYDDCSVTVVAGGEPIALLDAADDVDLGRYLSDYGIVIPGMNLLRLTYLTQLNLALVQRNWCDSAGACVGFVYDTALDPAATALLNFGRYEVREAVSAPLSALPVTGIYQAIFNELVLAAPDGSNAAVFAATLTGETLNLRPLSGATATTELTAQPYVPLAAQTKRLAAAPLRQWFHATPPWAATLPGSVARNPWTVSANLRR